MNGFDPDKFLNQDTASFDPDAFLGSSPEPQDNIIEEMHPAVSWKDRALVKNFANSQESSQKYLQTKYPNLQVKTGNDGRILMKGKTEKDWRVLDPDTGFFSSDFLQDVGDVAYDVGSGIVEGAATAGAGVAGGLATGGVGALPAAAGAGAATSASSEYLRQKLGEKLGLPQEVNTEDVKTAGAFGAVSPLLFGTGGQIAKAAAKQTLKEGAEELTKEGVEKLVKSQRGAFGKTYEALKERILPQAAELTSGVKSKNYSTYLKQLDTMKDWSNNPDKFTDYVTNVGKDIEKSVNMNLKNAGSEMGKIIDEVTPGMRFDVTDVYNGFKQQAESLKNSDYKEDIILGKKLDKQIDDLFISAKTGKLRNELSFDDAKVLRDKFKSLNKNFSAKLTGDPHRDAFMKMGDEGYALIDGVINDTMDLAEEGAGETFKAAKANYRKALQLRNQVESKLFQRDKTTGLKDYSKTLQTLRTMDNDSKRMVKDVMMRVDPTIATKADKAEAFLALNNPSWFPVSGTATSTSRTLAMGTAGYGLGQMTGEGGMGGVPGTVVGVGLGLLGLGPKAWRFYLSTGKQGEEMLKNQFRRAGQKVPRDLKKYFNRQMAIQSGANMTRSREE